MTNGNDLISSVPHIRHDSGIASIEYLDGMTKREMFAAMAMQGLLANSCVIGKSSNGFAPVNATEENIAWYAVFFADNLITALNAKE